MEFSQGERSCAAALLTLQTETGAASPPTARLLHLELSCLARRFCSWCEVWAQPHYMKNSGLKGGVKAFARSTL